MRKVYLIVLLGLMFFAKTEQLNAQCSPGDTQIASDLSASATSGWTFTNGNTANAIQQTGYWLVEKSGDVIISPTYTVNGSITVRFQTGTFGTVGAGPNTLIAEYTTNGTTWVSLGNAANPTSSTLVSSVLTISGNISSSTFQIRFSNTSSTAPGLRLDNIYICQAPPACTSQTITAISPSTITKIYGDATYSVATTASSGLTVGYASSNTAVATVDASGNVTIVAPGTATITASQGGNATYCAATSVTQALTVNQKTLTITGLTANNKTFDGTTTATLSGTAALSGVVSPDVITLGGTPVANFNNATVGTGKPVTVSGYSISGTNAGRYTLTQPTGLTADITAPVSPTISASGTLTAVSTTYGTSSGTTSFSVSGLSMNAGITITPPVGFQVSTASDFSSNVGDNASPIIVGAAGTIASTTIYVRLAANAGVTGTYNSQNISLTSSGATTVNVVTAASGNTVAAKALTITGLTATDKVYDRLTTVSVSGTPAYSGLVNLESFTVSGSVTWAFPDVNVGVGKVLTRTGTYSAPSANYTVTQPSLTASISAKALTVTGAVAQNKAYNGTTAATITGASLFGVISPDVVTVSGGGTFASANVGNAIAVTASLSLAGANAGNYTLTQPTGLSADITAIAPTFTTSTISIIVAGTYSLPGANVSSNSAGAFSYSLGTASPAGSVTLTGSTLNGVAVGTATLTINQVASGNYTAGSTTVTVNVTTFNVGDYRSASNGNWHSTAASNTASWEIFNGSGWVASSAPGTNAASLGTSTVYIRNDIFLVGTNTAPNVVVEATGIFSTSTVSATFGNLLVKSGGVFTRQGNGSGVSGVFEVEDNATVNFLHTNTTSRSTSIWAGTERFHSNSNFIIKSCDNTSNFLAIESNADVSEYNGACFGNLIIDLGAGQLQLLPSGFNKVLANNLQFKTTTGNIRLSNGNYTLSVLNNLQIDNTYGSTITALNTVGTATLNIGGNFIHNGTSIFRLTNNAGAVVTLNINGNLQVSAGGFDLGLAAGGTSTVNLKGDLDVAAPATMYAVSGTTCSFNFTGTGDGLSAATTQTVSVASSSATRNQNINFFATIGSYVQLTNQNLELGINSTFTVNGSGSTGATLDFNFNGPTPLNIATVSGATGTRFTSQQASVLKISSTLGISATSGSVGNVQVTNAPTYDQLATFWYIGKSSQQTGSGVSTTSNGKIIICDLTDNNTQLSFTNSVSFTNSTAINATGGRLDIRKGQVIETTTAYVTGSTGSLTMAAGTLYQIAKGSADAATAYGDLIPRMTGGTFPYILNGGIIELGGNSASNYFQVLRADDANYNYFNVKYSGANTLGTDYKALSAATNIDNSLIISGTAVVDCRSLSGTTPYPFQGNAGIVMDGGRLRIFDRSSPQPQLAGTASAYNLTGGVIEFYATGGGSSETIKGLDGNSNPIAYNQIEVTGTDVANSNSNITLRQGGKFTVKSTGVFTINDNAIVGPGTSETVEVETGGVFNCGNALGFNGDVVGFNSPSVRGGTTSNIETITLNSNSTVVYTRTGDQTITNTIPYQNLTISGTGNKTPTLNGTVTVQGNLSKTSSSTFVHNSSEVLFNNTTAVQTFSNTGTTAFNFYNLTNSNSFGTGLNIDGDCGVANGLSLTANAKLNLLSGNVTLLSENTRTAYVNTIPATAGIAYAGAGKFVVQRYLPIPLTTPARRWRLLTTPIQSTGAPTINAAWQEGQTNANRLAPSDLRPGFGTIITRSTTAANGYDQGSTNNPSIYKFDGSQPAPWQSLLATNTGAITDQEGYMIFVRGNRNFIVAGAGVPGSPTTLRVSGLINTGNISKPLDPVYPKLIGNPYPSAISFNKVLVNGVNPSTTAGVTFYLWDPKHFSGTNNVGGIITFTSLGNGFYTVAPNAVASGYTTGVYDGAIESGAAFLMPASAGSISFTENSKIQTSSTQGIASRPSGELAPTQKTAFFTTNLLSINGNDATVIDGVVNVCREDFDNKADEKDGPKLITFQTAEKLSLLRDEKLLGIELRKSFEENDSITYQLIKMKQANYQLAFVQNGFNHSLRAIAIDKFTGRKMLLSSTDTSLLPFTVSDNPASAAADRFKVVFKSAVKFNTVQADVVNADVKVEWNLDNEFDVNNYEVERSVDGIGFTKVGSIASNGNSLDQITYSALDLKPEPGIYWYRIKSVLSNGNVTYSDRVKVKLMNSKTDMYVFPNPVTNGNIGLQLNNQPQGKYGIRLLNALGETILSNQLVHAGGTASHHIAAPATAAGTYQLEVTAPGKKRQVLKVVVQ